MLDVITIGAALSFMGAALFSYQLVREDGSRFHWIGKVSVVMLAIMACTNRNYNGTATTVPVIQVVSERDRLLFSGYSSASTRDGGNRDKTP